MKDGYSLEINVDKRITDFNKIIKQWGAIRKEPVIDMLSNGNSIIDDVNAHNRTDGKGTLSIEH